MLGACAVEHDYAEAVVGLVPDADEQLVPELLRGNFPRVRLQVTTDRHDELDFFASGGCRQTDGRHSALLGFMGVGHPGFLSSDRPKPGAAHGDPRSMLPRPYAANKRVGW